MFNNKEEINYEEISESTKIEESELKRTLQSLACGKVQILLKNTKGIEINDTDVFSFNSKFSNKLYRIRINQVQLKETVKKKEIF